MGTGENKCIAKVWQFCWHCSTRQRHGRSGALWDRLDLLGGNGNLFPRAVCIHLNLVACSISEWHLMPTSIIYLCNRKKYFSIGQGSAYVTNVIFSLLLLQELNRGYLQLERGTKREGVLWIKGIISDIELERKRQCFWLNSSSSTGTAAELLDGSCLQESASPLVCNHSSSEINTKPLTWPLRKETYFISHLLR